MATASEPLEARAGGLKLHVEHRRPSSGSGGGRLLLLHGMGGNTHWWDRAAIRLSGLDTAALDFRGHGASGWAPDGSYSFEAFADDVESARSALGWDRFSIAAHSMGARAAIAYAARRPERLEKLVLVDFLAELHRPDGRFGRPMRPRQPSYGTAEDILAKFRLEPPETRLSPEEVRELAKDCVRQRPDGRWTWRFDWKAFTLSYPPVWPQLPGIRCPALIVRGELSRVMSRAHFERVSSGIAGARAVELPGAYHHVPLDSPQELAREMLSFL
jgi:pimeloyl-ACP methyl ester carboxylesterase